jgi:hypothetical protein
MSASGSTACPSSPPLQNGMRKVIHVTPLECCGYPNIYSPHPSGISVEAMKKCVWVRPEIVTRIEFLEWTDSEKTVSDYTRSSSTVREVSDHASLPSPLWP